MIAPLYTTRGRVRTLIGGAVTLGVILCGFFLAQSASALSTDFVVRTFVGTDTTPPTVPAPLTATPVAMTQINLAWGTSTDDYILSGYQVFRDGLQIATTTLATYSDVGLTASTTYAYYVTAYDSFMNISASSSVVATTTFATPTPSVTATSSNDGPSYGSRIQLPELVSLEVIPTQYGATIRFETESYVRAVVRWGTSISYELGSSVERSFSTYHEMVITDLRPDTRYRFSIEGETHMGRFGVLGERTFRTLPGDDVTPPGIVTGLEVQKVGDDIELVWVNPKDSDFDRVRVVRSTTFFPVGEMDGWVVHDGSGNSARDTGIAKPGSRIYYSVFSYDAKGNISSPAVISVQVPSLTDDGELPPVTDETEVNPINLTFDTLNFYQDGKMVLQTGGQVAIDGSKHLTVALPYDAVPEHLKTILVTISPKRDTDRQLQFLLKVNSDKTAYTARLAPLGVTGDFHIRVSVFDLKTAQVGHARGTIVSSIGFLENNEEDDSDEVAIAFLTFFGNNMWLFIMLLAIVFLYGMRSYLHEFQKDSYARE